MPRAANIGDWVGLIALTLLWGTSFALNEMALRSISPAMLVAGRVLIAAVVLFVVMRASGASLPGSPRTWLPLLVMALLGNFLPFQLVAAAQRHIDSSVAGVLMAVVPLFVLTLAHFFVPGSRLTPYRLAGFVAGFFGVVFVIGPDALVGLSGNAALWGAIAVLAAALSYAINSIYARRIGARDPLQLAAGTTLIAGLLCIPGAALELPTIALPTIGAVAAVVVLGVLSTGFATVLFFRIIQGPGPTFLSLVNYLVPAWAVLVGAWLLDESLHVGVYIGLALILIGIAISEIGPRFMSGMRVRRFVGGKTVLAAAGAEEA